MKWFGARLIAILEVAHSPERGFSRDLDGASWLVPLGVLGLMFALLTAVQSPMQLEWARFRWETAGVSPDHVAAATDMMKKSATAAMIMTPAFLLARWTFFAVIIWLVAQLRLHALSYRQTFTVVAYSYLPLAARDAFTSLILVLRGEEALRSSDGLNVPIGLNLLWRTQALPWSSIMANMNLFEVWFVLLLVVGVSKLGQMHWSRALVAVLPAWIFAVLLQLALASLGVSLQRSY